MSEIPASTASLETPVAATRLPELLAPAGDWECAKAAVENGADAIYFGLEKFNARMRALNFTEADLPRLMEFLHRRGVRGYVTLNTLVFQDELAEAKRYLQTMIASGIDAVIVQDVGICRLIRQMSPDFPIHASTQMSITSAAGVEFAQELGCSLVVLARECSLKEIDRINLALRASRRELPLEVFVHGALCVAYSGQCLTSEALGGRSANRGECAQACRMPYELISDDRVVPLGERRYLLSPQDLSGFEVLSELIRTGVASLKIEGRLKSPEYVANITRIYREALDRSARQTETSRADHASSAPPEGDGNPKYEMEMAFSRGLYTGWFDGINNQQLVHGRFGKKRGVYLGEVKRVLREGVAVQLAAPLKPGDGIVFDAGKPEEQEEGGRVFEVRSSGFGDRSTEAPVTEIYFGRGDINFERIRVGDKIWKTSDPELDRRLRRSFEVDQPRFQRPLEITVHGVLGKPVTLIARDEIGSVAKVESEVPLVRANKHPLRTERLREQLGRLGGTPFRLGALRNELVGDLMLPVKELNRLRREMVMELERLRSLPKRWTLTSHSALSEPAVQSAASKTMTQKSGPELIVLVRDLKQLEAVLGCGVSKIYCDFENPKKYRDAVFMVRGVRGNESSMREVFIAPPRIFKPGEEWILQQVRSCEADGYLLRNYDHLKFFSSDRRVGDFSLNVANRLSADYFKNRFGLERVTASYDLNVAQLEALLQAAPPEWFEITIHQHIPMFHMEHCVFCAFLSEGTDYTNCGRPCDDHAIRLRDRVGAEHPVKADVGCRNTVFNALAQTGAEYVSRMMALGVRHFRIEFLNESPEQVARTLGKYQQLFRGEISGAQLWRELKLLNQLGVTRGQM